MSGPKCAFNTAAALRRVFIPSNLGTSEYLHVTRIFVPALLASSLYQARAASWASPSVSRPGFNYNGRSQNTNNTGGAAAAVRRVGEPKRVQVKLARLPRNDEIRDHFVYLVEGKDSYGRPILSSPRQTKAVLADLDLEESSLQVITPSNVSEEELASLQWPVCQIINKRAELEKAKKEKNNKKASTLKEKTLELNWALSPHDLDHKIRTMQKFLASGYRVEVVLMRKQGGKARANAKDAQALLDRVVASADEVAGTTEWKKREGTLLNTMKINFQGKAQGNAQKKEPEKKNRDKRREKALEEAEKKKEDDE